MKLDTQTAHDYALWESFYSYIASLMTDPKNGMDKADFDALADQEAEAYFERVGKPSKSLWTYGRAANFKKIRKYPRIRGESGSVLYGEIRLKEIPPHTRGKHDCEQP